MNKIAIGSDHAGFELKQSIVTHLKERGIEVEDKGTGSKESTDYPDYGHAVSEEVKKGATGILICGTGNGISMSANRHTGIRAALCWLPEIASLARAHNNANILSLPARFVSVDQAIEIVDTFLSTPFEGGRHQRRIEKIEC